MAFKKPEDIVRPLMVGGYHHPDPVAVTAATADYIACVANMRFQVLAPVAARSADSYEVVDTQEHPNRQVLCTTTRDNAHRIAKAMEYAYGTGRFSGALPPYE